MTDSKGIAGGVAGAPSEMLAAVHTLGEWLGFSASCIKSGEAWSPTCETMRSEARAALTTLSRLAAPAEVDARVEADKLRIGWWNDMKSRGVSDDVAIGRIRAVLSAQPTGGE